MSKGMSKIIKCLILTLCFTVCCSLFVACGQKEIEKTELDAPVIASAVYTGEKLTADIPSNEGYTVVKNEGGTDVGEYDVVIKLSDSTKFVWKEAVANEAGEITLKFAITQADNAIDSLTLANWTFGETAKTPVATAKFGTPTFTYSDKEDGTFTDIVPTAVGSYFVKATVSETTNYKGATKTIAFSIEKVKATIATAPIAKENLAYTGSELELITAGSSNEGSLEYKLGADGTYGTTIPTATNAGEYNVYYKVVGDENHSDLEVETPITVSIAKVASTLTTAPTAKTLTYTGSGLELVNAGETADGTIQYKLDGEYSTAIPTATNAGTYTVYYKVVADSNHNDSAEASVEVTINKASAKVTAPTAIANPVYTGSAQALVEAGTTADGTIQYKLGTDGTYGTTIPTATNAGTYTVYYKVVADDNHNDSAEASVDVTIAKAVNTITLSVNLDCNWGSGPDETKATATYGTPVYTYWLSNSDSTGDVTEPDSDAVFKSWSECNAVGVYKCKISVAESENYQAGEIHTWVRVHKKETDANGVKYTYGDGAYYVSGYVGSSTEVTVASTFNDGVNGEKSVTYVGQNAFINNTAITKVVLPETVTCFGGGVFLGCTSLVSVDMRGVKNLYQDNQTAGLDGSTDRNINFWNCSALQYVIVGSGFKTNVAQYNGDNALTLYVNGTDATNITNTDKIGTTYYLGNGTDCLTWKFNENGEIVKGASAHTFENGACKTCGADQTEGITYAVSGDTAYVVSYSGTATEVYVRSTYEDKPVTYVAQRAFENKTMKKVVLPESVTDLGGFVFHQCPNLEYVDARGVKNIQYANASARADGTNESNNNFRSCDKLTTVIIGDGFSSNVGQFTGSEKTINLYVYGSTAITTQDGDNVLTGVVYYLGNGTDCLTWKFDDDGNIVKGASAHSFEDGKCTACGIYNTQGVNYVYDSTNQCYYVGNNKTLNVSELTILSKYDDGTNGEHNVT